MAGGLLQDTGVWDTSANWTGAAPPGNGDLASIPKSQQNNIVGPTGANQQVKVSTFHSHPEFIRDVGSPGSPCVLAAGLVHVQGRGNFYFQSKLDGVSANITDEVRVEAASAASRVEIGSDPTDAGSNIIAVNLMRGDVILTGTIEFATTGFVFVGSMTGSEGARCEIVSTADTLPEYIQVAGFGKIDNIVTRLDVSGGTCIKDVNKAVYIDVWDGGNLVYDHAAAAGEVLICRVHTGATLNLNENGLLKEFDKTYLYRGGNIESTAALHTLNLVDMGREG